MIIRNKHPEQEIGVTDKNNLQIFLKPGDTVEVNDNEGKGYLANYANFFEKVDAPTDESNREEEKAKMTIQIQTLTKLVERLTNGKPEELQPEVLSEKEKELVDTNKTNEDDEKKERAELIGRLKEAGAKGVGNHWSTDKLREAKQTLINVDETVTQ